MIASLEGKLKHKSPDYLIVDVQGVGYCVHVPLSTFYALPELQQTVALHIHTHVREDILQLYGFQTAAEKEMFLYLITITGVGPRLAVGILSGISPDQLRQVVLQHDHGRLKNIPGVGKKIAERILLELRDKLKIRRQEQPDPILEADRGAYADAFSALVNLGYRSAEADKVLQKVQQQAGASPPLEELLKEALRLLA